MKDGLNKKIWTYVLIIMFIGASTIPVISGQDETYFYANQDIPVQNGGITGSYINTQSSDDSYEEKDGITIQDTYEIKIDLSKQGFLPLVREVGGRILQSKEKWNVSPENIICKKYNVRIDKVDDYEINDDVIEKVKSYMRESIAEMKELLSDKQENTAREEDFELTEDENECRMCNFKKVCPKWS